MRMHFSIFLSNFACAACCARKPAIFVRCDVIRYAICSECISTVAGLFIYI